MGGVGHSWVKKLFIDKHYENGEDPNDYTFIFATVDDNKALLESSPDYVNMLNNLPPKLREMWRYGNWDLVAGQYFTEFDRNIHVIEPFEVPEHWKRYCGMDYGLDQLAIIWMAVDEHNNIFVYREYSEPNVKIADASLRYLEHTHNENIINTYAPPDMWGRSQESGKSKVDIFYENGWTNIVKSNNNREAGWLAIADLLKVVNQGEGFETECKLHFFNTCTHLIEYLPELQVDDRHPTDCATEPHEITHLPDALRYALVQYTSASKKPVEFNELADIKRRILRQNAKRGRR